SGWSYYNANGVVVRDILKKLGSNVYVWTNELNGTTCRYWTNQTTSECKNAGCCTAWWLIKR
ncbi:MAG: hypothetical protein LBB15_01805, partial [Puniceicoccales bacterium]|nr:hypothetical protein [Puniceicoccales bacterium]